MNAKRPKAPAHLQPLTRRWWVELHERFELESHHTRLATIAADAWDRSESARKLLAKDGLVFTDDKGMIRPHPAVAVQKDAANQFMRALRELALDVAPPQESRLPRPGWHRKGGAA